MAMVIDDQRCEPYRQWSNCNTDKNYSSRNAGGREIKSHFRLISYSVPISRWNASQRQWRPQMQGSGSRWNDRHCPWSLSGERPRAEPLLRFG